MTRLLILACAQRKRPDVRLLPALQRYNGPAWQVLRATLRHHPALNDHLVVYALSAAYGLFPAIQPIPDYDRRMNRARASELVPACHTRMATLVATHPMTDTFISVGSDYLLALAGAINDHEPALGRITFAWGGYGERLSQLKQWLLAGIPA